VIDGVRRIVQGLDPSLPLANVRTLDEIITESQSRPRFLTAVLSSFAGVALLLAAVGIYGVISYSVTQRTREFGVRMALGAAPRNVLGLVMHRGALLILGGVALGIIGSFASTRFLSTFLFGITATDPLTFAVVALVLAAIGAIASYLPARRATRIDPLVALRVE
jgi:putative ABC transport system permease protein